MIHRSIHMLIHSYDFVIDTVSLSCNWSGFLVTMNAYQHIYNYTNFKFIWKIKFKLSARHVYERRGKIFFFERRYNLLYLLLYIHIPCNILLFILDNRLETRPHIQYNTPLFYNIRDFRWIQYIMNRKSYYLSCMLQQTGWNTWLFYRCSTTTRDEGQH